MAGDPDLEEAKHTWASSLAGLDTRLRARARSAGLTPPSFRPGPHTLFFDFGRQKPSPHWKYLGKGWEVERGAFRSKNAPDKENYLTFGGLDTVDFDVQADFEAAHDMHIGAWPAEEVQTYNYSGYIAFVGGYGNIKSVIRSDANRQPGNDGNLSMADIGLIPGRHTMRFSRRGGWLWLFLNDRLIGFTKDLDSTRHIERIGFLGGWGGHQVVFSCRLYIH